VQHIDDELAAILGMGINAPDGTPLNIFGTIAHHPRLLKRFMNFAGLFLNKGLLPAREREIVILRVGWNCQSVYEFGQHTIIGERVGLSLDEVAALAMDAVARVQFLDLSRRVEIARRGMTSHDPPVGRSNLRLFILSMAQPGKQGKTDTTGWYWRIPPRVFGGRWPAPPGQKGHFAGNE